MLPDVTYTQNLEKPNSENREQIGFLPRDRTWGKQGDAGQRSRLPIIRRIKSGDLVYIMVYLKAAKADHQCLHHAQNVIM